MYGVKKLQFSSNIGLFIQPNGEIRKLNLRFYSQFLLKSICSKTVLVII